MKELKIIEEDQLTHSSIGGAARSTKISPSGARRARTTVIAAVTGLFKTELRN
jgi:hypothetical protein